MYVRYQVIDVAYCSLSEIFLGTSRRLLAVWTAVPVAPCPRNFAALPELQVFVVVVSTCWAHTTLEGAAEAHPGLQQIAFFMRIDGCHLNRPSNRDVDDTELAGMASQIFFKLGKLRLFMLPLARQFRLAILRPGRYRRLLASTALKRSNQSPSLSPNPQTVNNNNLNSRGEQQPEINDESAEEPLLLPAEQGYGYYHSAVVGHRLNQYEIVRKVSLFPSLPSPVIH